MHELLRDTYRQVADVHSESPREEHSFGSIPVASDLAPSVRVSSTPAVAPTPAIGLEDILGERHERERDTQRRVQRRQRGIGDLYERGVNAMRKRDELVEVQRREQEERETAHPFAPQLCLTLVFAWEGGGMDVDLRHCDLTCALTCNLSCK